MVWIMYWRNWETPVPQLGNQEVDVRDSESEYSGKCSYCEWHGSEPYKGALKCIKPRVKLQGRQAFITRQCTALFIGIFN